MFGIKCNDQKLLIPKEKLFKLLSKFWFYYFEYNVLKSTTPLISVYETLLRLLESQIDSNSNFKNNSQMGGGFSNSNTFSSGFKFGNSQNSGFGILFLNYLKFGLGSNSNSKNNKFGGFGSFFN